MDLLQVKLNLEICTDAREEEKKKKKIKTAIRTDGKILFARTECKKRVMELR